MQSQGSSPEEERVLAEAPVYGDPNALFFSGKTGTIECTESQIIFDGKKNTVHISLDDVSSLELDGPTWSRAYLYSGVTSLLYGIFGNGPGLPTLALVVGPVLLATGYWLRVSRLTIFTTTRNYEFTSRGNALDDIVKAVRSRGLE